MSNRIPAQWERSARCCRRKTATGPARTMAARCGSVLLEKLTSRSDAAADRFWHTELYQRPSFLTDVRPAAVAYRGDSGGLGEEATPSVAGRFDDRFVGVEHAV